MKKFLYLLLALPLALTFASCSDDDKVPVVEISAEVSNAVVSDNVIYIVQGEPLVVEGLNIVSHSGKEAAIGAVTYYLDGVPLGTSVVAPFGFTMSTESLAPGKYLLTAQAPVLVVDYPVSTGFFRFNIQVVEDASELPGAPATAFIPGSVSIK